MPIMSNAGSNEIRLAAVGIGILLAILIALGARSPQRAAPQPPRTAGYHGLPDPNVDPSATAEEIKQLALRTGGDYSRLSYDERVWIEAVSAHHGEITLRSMAKHFADKAYKSSPRDRSEKARGFPFSAGG
jgi:hypothetical protein